MPLAQPVTTARLPSSRNGSLYAAPPCVIVPAGSRGSMTSFMQSARAVRSNAVDQSSSA